MSARTQGVRRKRARRTVPIARVQVCGYGVSIYVRTGRLSGRYSVDPGFRTAPDGWLHRAPVDDVRAVGRRAAVRAAQHSARRHLSSEDGWGRVPNGPVVPFGAGVIGLSDRSRLSLGLWRHPHGTYVVTVPSLVMGDEWRTWDEHGYRGRRRGVRAYQWGRRYACLSDRFATVHRRAD